MCSYMADAGAEVWKIETLKRMSRTRGNGIRPGSGPMYPNCEPGARPWNRSAYYNVHNRNKLGFTLDVSEKRGRELYLQMVSLCDIVIENFSTHVMPQLHIGYDDLRAVRPDIIMVSLSPYGQTGPYKDHTTYGFSLDSMSGHASLRGYPDQDMSQVDPAYPQDQAGVHTAIFAALTAVRHRLTTGQGQWIDLSQTEAFMDHIGEQVLGYSMSGRTPRPVGNQHQSMAPHGAYPCLGVDRWVTIAVATDEEWRNLCRLMGNPTWANSPKFATAPGRYQNRSELDTHLAEWTSRRHDYETMKLLQGAGVRCTVVMDASQIHSDEHLRARGFFQSAPHVDAGTHDYPGRAWKFSNADMRIVRPPNTLGEHNSLLFREYLGLSPEAMASLEKGSGVGTEFLPGADR